MTNIQRELRGRVRDIFAYLRLLQFLQKAGAVQDRDGKLFHVDLETIHVMKAGVFLHLYNLVESTVTAGLERIAEDIRASGLKFQDINDPWRRAWVISLSKLDEDLAVDNRLMAALSLCEAVASGITLDIKPKISVGNLDDRRIDDLFRKYGITVRVSPAVHKKVKYQVLNDQGFLGLVRVRRNALAHGLNSFADVGRDYTADDLVKWTWGTYHYLKDLLRCLAEQSKLQNYRRTSGAP